MRRLQYAAGFCAVLTTLFTADVQAQVTDPWQRLMPHADYFRPPIADPLEPRFSVSLLRTDLLSRHGGERPHIYLPDPDDSAQDVVAAVALGVTFPIAQLKSWAGGGLLLTGHAGVNGRFRIEYPSRDDMGQDWVVGGGLMARWSELSGRLRIHHRSSHMGDEFAKYNQAERIEFGGEAIEGMAAYQAASGARVYGGGSWIVHSNTAGETVLAEWGRPDRYTVQVGGDIERFPWKGGVLGYNAGVDWQAAERTNWRGAFAAAAGVHSRNAAQLGFSVRFFTGPSTMGEFFLTKETYWAFELTGRF